MSRFLDRIERINNGLSSPIGFGAVRAEKLPGMGLVAQVSGDHSAGLAVVSDLAPDAALLSGISDLKALKSLGQSLSSVPWGARLSSLSEEAAQDCREGGCDLLAFSLPDTAISAVASDEIARILCVAPDIEERELWAIDTLPVDVLLLPMRDVSSPWTLRNLATIGAVSGRVNKYILVEVSDPPSPKELEALRNAGVHGLVLDVGAVSPKALAGLKTGLLDLPRQQPARRERPIATLSGTAYTMEPWAGQEEEEGEGEEDE